MKFYNYIFELISLCIIKNTYANNWYRTANNSFHELDNLLNFNLSGYDRRIRPIVINEEGEYEPTEIQTDIYLRSISNLDFAEMQISIELTFREKWTDPRLILGEENDNFQIGGNDENYITLTDISQIWKPDSFFQEEKESHLHSIDVPNVFARIYPNGSITYSQRISLVISCPMYLHDYPLDVQRCPLSIASYGYTTEDITYVWKKNDPIQLYPKLKSSLPNFKISDISINNCSSITNTGTYSCIQLTIEFHRRSGYYIFHIFIPSALLVIVSCLSFWMHHSAVPARVSLGLLTLLTIITQAASLEHNMPGVNYLKAMDLWLGMCLSFAFFAVLELGIVSFISTFEYPRFYCRKHYSSGKDVWFTPKASISSMEKLKECSEALLPKEKDMEEKSEKSGVQQNECDEVWSAAEHIDRVSRYLFSTSFVIFAFMYWSKYAGRLFI